MAWREELTVGELKSKRGVTWGDGDAETALPKVYVAELGAVTVADADGVLTAVATATGVGIAGYTLATGAALVSVAGTADLVYPRSIAAVISVTTAQTASVTVTGTDAYGADVVETRAFSGTTATFKKAFKTVTGVNLTADLTATSVTLAVGTTDVLGLPYRLANLGKMVSIGFNGRADYTGASTVVGGLAATGVSTATTADVRGTVDPHAACNGSYVTVAFALDTNTDGSSTKAKLKGAAQYGG